MAFILALYIYQRIHARVKFLRYSNLRAGNVGLAGVDPVGVGFRCRACSFPFIQAFHQFLSQSLEGLEYPILLIGRGIALARS